MSNIQPSIVQLDIAGTLDCDSTPCTAMPNDVVDVQNWRWVPKPELEPGLSGPAVALADSLLVLGDDGFVGAAEAVVDEVDGDPLIVGLGVRAPLAVLSGGAAA